MSDLLSTPFSNAVAAVPLAVAALRLGAALVLGGIVGFEREHRDKPAGLRTHMLVAAAACLFALVGLELTRLDFAGSGQMRVDPLRLIEAVTSGVAFLAAGVIITAGGKVKNLTTGASMWMAGAIGLACGAGQMPLALLATLLVLAVLWLVRSFEKRFGTHD